MFKSEPIFSLPVLVPIIVWAAARFGFSLDDSTATYIAGAVLAGTAWLARRQVTPVANPHDSAGRPLVPTSIR